MVNENENEQIAEQIENLQNENQEIAEERENLWTNMSLKQKIKYLIKQYGLTITGIIAITSTIIFSILSSLKNGLSSLAKNMGNGLKDLAKKFAGSIPGIIGTLISYLLQSGGELLSFISKHIWILILIIITFVMEQFKNKLKVFF